MTRELTIPTTGEVLDLETATTTDVALELERVDDVIGQLDEARADLKAELIARLDRSNRRSAEVGDWRLETNAPTSEDVRRRPRSSRTSSRSSATASSTPRRSTVLIQLEKPKPPAPEGRQAGAQHAQAAPRPARRARHRPGPHDRPEPPDAQAHPPRRGDPMTSETKWVLGVEPCGCVTVVHTNPEKMGKGIRADLGDLVAKGGEVIRATEEEARAMPNFFPAKCPHDPPGWEFEEGR
jgi:hypothetical protein